MENISYNNQQIQYPNYISDNPYKCNISDILSVIAHTRSCFHNQAEFFKKMIKIVTFTTGNNFLGTNDIRRSEQKSYWTAQKIPFQLTSTRAAI